MLVVVGGLPATGKTTVCRLVAARTGAVHVRVDTVEQALVDAGLQTHPVGPAGYVVAYALAREQLRQGRSVLAESVNPLAATRDAWRAVAQDAAVPVLEVELVCSDRAEHRRRAEERGIDVPGLPRPTWAAIEGRALEPWDRSRVVVDTAVTGPQDAASLLVDLMADAAR